MSERHEEGRKPTPDDVRRMVGTVKAMNAPFSDIEFRITVGVIGISAFFFVSAFISILTLNAVVQKQTELITRLDRLTAIAVMDSARVDSLMVAHPWIRDRGELDMKPKRGAR